MGCRWPEPPDRNSHDGRTVTPAHGPRYDEPKIGAKDAGRIIRAERSFTVFLGRSPDRAGVEEPAITSVWHPATTPKLDAAETALRSSSV